jgi:acetyl esterase/lipase
MNQMVETGTVAALSRERFDELVDPELRPYLRRLAKFDLSDIAAARALTDQVAKRDVPGQERLRIEDRVVTGHGEVPVRVRVYTPRELEGLLPGIVFMHGGGYVIGSVDSHHDMAVLAALTAEAVVVSVDYRLAPEHPYPAALEDCYSALNWLRADADSLGVDPARIVVSGISAGGGLAAGLALMARDRGGPAVLAQCLAQPSLDDRPRTRSRQTYVDTPVWSADSNRLSWQSYLGGASGVSPYAAPARAVELAGLPPAYLAVCELDALRDEGIGYATRLLAAGVPVELHVYPGTFHGSQRILKAGVSRRMQSEWNESLRRATGNGDRR